MARARVKLRDGEILNLIPEDPFFFVSHTADHDAIIGKASNTRRSGGYFDKVRGLFTLDSTPDSTHNGEHVEGVKYRETIATNFRGYDVDNGDYVIINAKDIVYVRTYDDISDAPASEEFSETESSEAETSTDSQESTEEA